MTNLLNKLKELDKIFKKDFKKPIKDKTWENTKREILKRLPVKKK